MPARPSASFHGVSAPAPKRNQRGARTPFCGKLTSQTDHFGILSGRWKAWKKGLHSSGERLKELRL
jgi:hypothetical protein